MIKKKFEIVIKIIRKFLKKFELKFLKYLTILF